MFRKTTSLRDEFHDAKTQAQLTAVMPIPKTEKIPAVIPHKTSQFCSMINMIIHNGFAVVTIQFGKDNYRVLHLSSYGINHIDVHFSDFGGKVWCTRVSSWNAFSIFRGV